MFNLGIIITTLGVYGLSHEIGRRISTYYLTKKGDVNNARIPS